MGLLPAGAPWGALPTGASCHLPKSTPYCVIVSILHCRTWFQVQFSQFLNFEPDFGQVCQGSGSNFGSGPNRGITILDVLSLFTITQKIWDTWVIEWSEAACTKISPIYCTISINMSPWPDFQKIWASDHWSGEKSGVKPYFLTPLWRVTDELIEIVQ